MSAAGHRARPGGGARAGLASLVILLFLIGGTAEAARAQEGEGQPPEGWMVRSDRGGHGGGDVEFIAMPPGWHVTTGPAVILYDPARTAAGTYRVEAEVHLFDPGQRREGFGVFFGGRDLDGDGQAYTYFLIRRDGRFLVKRRDGAETAVLVDWTEAPAVVGWEERDEGAVTVRNVLAVEVGAEEITFSVNGGEVARLPRDGLSAEGVVGLRVNHSLNLHVTRLEVESL